MDEGVPVHLNVVCEAEPEPAFDWYCNGIVLHNSGDFMIHQDRGESTLTIQRPQPKHTGMYKCVVTNPSGRSVSDAHVEIKPKSKSLTMTFQTAITF